MQILIIEDDLDIHTLMKELLHKEGYAVLSAYSGSEALYVLEKETPDLLLLDLMLPGVHGEEILKRVKNIPIIVLSAKAEIDSKVHALLEGANDYITKPFDVEELLARIKVQMRLHTKQRNTKDLRYKNLTLSADGHTVYIDAQPLHVTKIEYSILQQLLSHPSQVITKGQLLDRIYEDTLDGAQTSLKVHISNLRKKLRTISDIEYIESVWGIGFKLME